VPALRAAHPQIELEITVANAMANLTRREADIAIRPTAEPPGALVGRRIASIAHAVYGSSDLLSRHVRSGRSKNEWIGLDESLRRQ